MEVLWTFKASGEKTAEYARTLPREIGEISYSIHGSNEPGMRIGSSGKFKLQMASYSGIKAVVMLFRNS
jgi:hypothetical protein